MAPRSRKAILLPNDGDVLPVDSILNAPDLTTPFVINTFTDAEISMKWLAR
jgi:hypothetical protein